MPANGSKTAYDPGSGEFAPVMVESGDGVR